MFARKFAIFLFAVSATASAETHSFTLIETLQRAARQSPDAILARLDAERADEGVKIAKDPFRPKVYAGSGLAYTYGYPNSIEGNAPSLVQVRTDMALYNRPKAYQLASAREVAQASFYSAEARANDAEYQAADLFLTASELEHESSTISNQLPSLQKVVDVMNAEVNEGSQLPLELKRAQVNLAESQQRLQSDELDADYYEMMLAVALGYPATDRVKPLDSEPELNGIAVPPTEQDAADTALRNNRELREMQSNILARQLDVRAYQSARRPTMDLVAQYALFAKYNYEQYFQKFQANNFQIGASITIPVFIGPANGGLKAQANIDLQKMRVQTDQLRNRILSDTRHNYEQWKKAESLRDLARMQLDLAREELTVLLAQNSEGRASLSRVEQARLDESNRWISLYDAEAQVARAKLAILRQTGNLVASIRASEGVGNPQ